MCTYTCMYYLCTLSVYNRCLCNSYIDGHRQLKHKWVRITGLKRSAQILRAVSSYVSILSRPCHAGAQVLKKYRPLLYCTFYSHPNSARVRDSPVGYNYRIKFGTYSMWCSFKSTRNTCSTKIKKRIQCYQVSEKGSIYLRVEQESKRQLILASLNSFKFLP